MTEETKRKSFHFNIGIIAFLMIFVYIIGHLILSVSKEELAVYQVIQSRIHESIRTTGIILREETIVKSDNAGYLNYYVNDGEIVSKHGLVYTSDRTGEAHEYISHFLEQKKKLTASDYNSIRDLLENFEENFHRKLTAADAYANRPRNWMLYTVIVLVIVMLVGWSSADIQFTGMTVTGTEVHKLRPVLRRLRRQRGAFIW